MVTRAEELVLVDAAKAGDGVAFARLVGRYEVRLYAASYQLVGNPSDAADIVQETFLRAYRAIGRTNDTLNVSAWLHRIALNVGRDLLRRRAVRREQPWETCADHPSEHPRDNPLGTIISSEERHAVRRALELLPPHYRQALLLREYNGLSSQAIGATMGIPALAVKSLLFRSRVAFRKTYRVLVTVPPAAGEQTSAAG